MKTDDKKAAEFFRFELCCEGGWEGTAMCQRRFPRTTLAHLYSNSLVATHGASEGGRHVRTNVKPCHR